MSCYHPIFCLYHPYKKGKLIFKSPKINTEALKSQGYVETTCPCGQCIGCKSRVANDYATRMMFDIEYYASLTKEYLPVSFLTLTYDDENLPYSGLLNIEHIRKFIGAYRKYCQRHRDNEIFRYFVKGEYGSKTHRPHYHIMLLGDDCLPMESDTDEVKAEGAVERYSSGRGNVVMNSPVIRHYWKYGRVNALAVVDASSKAYNAMVAYTAGYSTKLDNPTRYYSIDGKEQVERELLEDKTWCACSRYLGLEFFRKYHSHILRAGSIGRYGKDGNHHRLAIPRTWSEYAKIYYPQEYEDYRQKRIEYATSEKAIEELKKERLLACEYKHLEKFNNRIRPYEVGSPDFLQFEKIVRW